MTENAQNNYQKVTDLITIYNCDNLRLSFPSDTVKHSNLLFLELSLL